jgi:flagellar basal-body rod protein FlgB
LAGNSRFASSREGGYEARTSGNAVSLEDEMMKVAANQMDYRAATSLCSASPAASGSRSSPRSRSRCSS